MKRFFIDSISDKMTISGDEFKHGVEVLRVKIGEEIILSNNTEYDFICKVTAINKRDFEVELIEKKPNFCECKNEVTLVCGYLKGDKTELVVQKAVELGVKNIIVFSSKFSSSFISENKLERLNRVSVESAKQCGRSVAPKVTYMDNLKDALEKCKDFDNKIFACEFQVDESESLKVRNGKTCIVVGSEGGFSVEEAEEASKLQYKTITLGKRILRAETASIALLSIVLFELGEMA